MKDFFGILVVIAMAVSFAMLAFAIAEYAVVEYKLKHGYKKKTLTPHEDHRLKPVEGTDGRVWMSDALAARFKKKKV